MVGLEAAGSPPFVPAGRSIWEFGVGGKPAEKFDTEYKKRANEITPDKRQETVPSSSLPPQELGTTRILNLPDFVQEYRDKREFEDVKYYDGVQREDSGCCAARRSVLGMPALCLGVFHRLARERHTNFGMNMPGVSDQR